MLKKQHSVSVIMPVYNRGHLAVNSIKSVLKQTYDNIELIIVDDKSEDDTFNFLSDFTKEYKNVKVVLNEEKKGVSGARNFGIKQASGEYIAFLDSDDQYYEYHIEKSISLLEKHGMPLAFALWNEKFFLKNGEVQTRDCENVKKRIISLANEIGAFHDSDCIVFDSRFFDYICTSNYYCYHINTMVIKRKKLISNDLFDESLSSSEDVELTGRLIHKFGALIILDYHYIYNQGNDNLFFFVDRNTLQLSDILESDALIVRFSDCFINKIKMYEKRIEYFESNKEKLFMYDKCIKVTNYLLSEKYYVLAVINQIKDKAKACEYMNKAILYSINDDIDEKKSFIKKMKENSGIFQMDMCKHSLF